MTNTPKLNQPLLDELYRDLLRLKKPGQTLSKSDEWLKPIAANDMDRDVAIAAATFDCGCEGVKGQKISENPEVIGVVFTKHEGPLPALDWSEPEGSA